MKNIFMALAMGLVLISPLMKAETEAVEFQKKEVTRELDPRYILNAVTGATTAVAQLKEEKHPNEPHPLSFLAVLLQETSKLVNYNIQKQEETKGLGDLSAVNYDNELKELLSFLEQQRDQSKMLSKTLKYTKVINEYLQASEEEKAACFEAINQDSAKKRSLIKDLFFVTGNFVAAEAQDAADLLSEELYTILMKQQVLSKSECMVHTRSLDVFSPESQLIEMVSDLVEYTKNLEKKDNMRADENVQDVVLEHFIEIALVLKKAVEQDEAMYDFWKETPYLGMLMAAEGFAERKEVIESFMGNDEVAQSFVYELVQCMYHVVFNKLGKMLVIAYDVLQATVPEVIEYDEEEEVDVLFEDECEGFEL